MLKIKLKKKTLVLSKNVAKIFTWISNDQLLSSKKFQWHLKSEDQRFLNLTQKIRKTTKIGKLTENNKKADIEILKAICCPWKPSDKLI